MQQAATATALLEDSLKRADKEVAPLPSFAEALDAPLKKYEVGDILPPPRKKGATEPLDPNRGVAAVQRGGRRGLRDLGPGEVAGGDQMVMVWVSDGDGIVMLLVGDSGWMVMVLVGHADRMVMVLVGDGDRMVMVLVGDGDGMVMVQVEDGDCRHGGHPHATVLLSFIYFSRQCVCHFKSEGGMVLLSFICFQRPCVIRFKTEGHWWAWGDCVLVSQLFSTSMCHSFQKRGSPVGFLFSACHQRLFGWLRFFKLNFSLIFNLLNFFAGFFNGLHTCFNF